MQVREILRFNLICSIRGLIVVKSYSKETSVMTLYILEIPNENVGDSCLFPTNISIALISMWSFRLKHFTSVHIKHAGLPETF